MINKQIQEPDICPLLTHYRNIKNKLRIHRISSIAQSKLIMNIVTYNIAVLIALKA